MSIFIYFLHVFMYVLVPILTCTRIPCVVRAWAEPSIYLYSTMVPLNPDPERLFADIVPIPKIDSCVSTIHSPTTLLSLSQDQH